MRERFRRKMPESSERHKWLIDGTRLGPAPSLALVDEPQDVQFTPRTTARALAGIVRRGENPMFGQGIRATADHS